MPFPLLSQHQQGSWTLLPSLVELHCSGAVPSSLQTGERPASRLHHHHPLDSVPLRPSSPPNSMHLTSPTTPANYVGTGATHTSRKNRCTNTSVRVHSQQKGQSEQPTASPELSKAAEAQANNLKITL